MKTILLAGATGFLGSHLLEAFLAIGYRVVILKRSSSDTWRIRHLLADVKVYDVDTAPQENAFMGEEIDVVVNTVCHYGRNDAPLPEIVETNLMFGIRLLAEAERFGVGTFINTDTLLTKHLNIYTLSKKQFVEWLYQESKIIKVINLKLEHMYGPKDDTTKLVPWVISQFKAGVPEIKLTQGFQTRDFIYVDDVVNAYLVTLEKADVLDQFSEFDVGTGKAVSVRYFLETLRAAYERTFGSIPTKLAFGAIPYRDGEIMAIDVQNQPLMNLGWTPQTAIYDGIANILEEHR